MLAFNDGECMEVPFQKYNNSWINILLWYGQLGFSDWPGGIMGPWKENKEK